MDLAAKDMDIIFVQELAREEHGWNSFETDSYQWITHRAADQWRGVGIAISLDRFDSVVYKSSTSRGIWLVVRIRGIGRILLGALHCHTGVTNAVYQGAVLEFVKSCPRKYRHLPLLCGVDANEVPRWIPEGEEEHLTAAGSSNINILISELANIGAMPKPPRRDDVLVPTHYPRDDTRRGRQIDMIFARQAQVDDLLIEPERRHSIGSDHAIISGELFCSSGSTQMKWGNDSRPRWVCSDLPTEHMIIEEEDLCELAKRCTRPRRSQAYSDSAEIRDAILHAKSTKLPADWKKSS